MTSIVKSASDATSSVFGTVSTVAHQATRTVETFGQGLDMLNMFVSTAHTKQKARTAVDLAMFYDDLVEQSSLEAAKRQLEISKELANDSDLKKMYIENEKKLGSIVSALQTKTNHED